MIAARLVSALFASAVGLALGCTGPSPPDPSDPEVGRELLKKALDGWKRGDAPEAVSGLTVIEWSWKKGGKLLDYEIQNDFEHAGYDVRFKVKLNVKDPGGAMKKQNALYNVCTTPSLVVKRAEGSW